MVTTKDFQPAVRRYLEELELELKKLSGVAPEEAISDAREFLTADANALERSGEPPHEQEHFDWIVQSYGEPKTVARQYADQSEPVPSKRGYAPGWRICCTKCGRSAPLASIGAIRIGAKSWHKYTLGNCRGCNRLRFLRIIQDLEKTNLTDELGLNKSPEQVRATMHRPMLTVLGILVAIAVSIGMVAMVALTIFLIVWRMNG